MTPTTNNTQLPAEVESRIDKEASDAMQKEQERLQREYPEMEYGLMLHQIHGFQDGYRSCATEYASKLHQAEQEIAQLKQWKAEASELVNPILRYGQSKEAGIQLGESIIEVVLERCKQYTTARTILSKVYDDFIGSTEMSENKTDRKLFKQIKQFLDAEK